MTDNVLKFDALVVGGGIAGMQAALDLGDQGYRVALVEKEASIGGKMIALSKVFPTLDCCSCITTPKMSAVAHHENISLFTYCEVEGIHSDKGNYSVGNIDFEVLVKNIHPVDTYGIKFFLGKEIVSLVSDTKYFDGLVDAYKDSTVLIVNVVFYESRRDYDHLNLKEALDLIKEIGPKKAILTHFGMSMLRAKPHLLEKQIKKDFPSLVFAYDGFSLEFPF